MDEPYIKSQLSVFQRIAIRGLNLSSELSRTAKTKHERKAHSNYVDLFQHLHNEVKRIINNGES